MDDNILAKGIKSGSYDDFTSLYNRYFNKLFGFILKLTYSYSVTEEIVQDTFVKLWANRESIDENGYIQAYIFTIAKNKLLDEIRSSSNTKNFEDYLHFCDVMALSQDDMSREIDIEHYQYKLKTAKQVLLPRQLEIFNFFYDEGLTTKEISENLGISERTVQNQISISLKKLKETIRNNN